MYETANPRIMPMNTFVRIGATVLVSIAALPVMAGSGTYPGALNKTSAGKYTLRVDPAKHDNKIVKFVTLPKGISWVKEKKLNYSGLYLSQTLTAQQTTAWVAEFCQLRSLSPAGLKITKKNAKKNNFTFTCR